MKRTAEIVLGSIALALQFLVIIFVVPLLAIISLQFPEIISPKFEAWYAWFAVIVLAVGFFSGLIALIMMKNSPKKSGVIFIVTATLMFFLTLGATMIQTILFIIAGVMCLTRRSVTTEVTS
ncbi:hypothetical protein [Pseudogracilibacillus sp. SO30301A]|uniref:hypothetical protein n=1 Tax=Pseudogracilibacillus sp. SO30301A TaxID=3098291 RepID=UPI00300DBF12